MIDVVFFFYINSNGMIILKIKVGKKKNRFFFVFYLMYVNCMFKDYDVSIN